MVLHAKLDFRREKKTCHFCGRSEKRIPLAFHLANADGTRSLEQMSGGLTASQPESGNVIEVGIFGFKSCVILAVCGQIWPIFWGTYDPRSS